MHFYFRSLNSQPRLNWLIYLDFPIVYLHTASCYSSEFYYQHQNQRLKNFYIRVLRYFKRIFYHYYSFNMGYPSVYQLIVLCFGRILFAIIWCLQDINNLLTTAIVVIIMSAIFVSLNDVIKHMANWPVIFLGNQRYRHRDSINLICNYLNFV